MTGVFRLLVLEYSIAWACVLGALWSVWELYLELTPRWRTAARVGAFLAAAALLGWLCAEHSIN